MLNENERLEALRRFCYAVSSVAADLAGAGGLSRDAIAAGLRIEASKIELANDRPRMSASDQELLDLARRAHEFINTLIIAGIDERVAVVSIGNTLVERVARSNGAAGAANWLRGLAALVDQHGDDIEATAQAH